MKKCILITTFALFYLNANVLPIPIDNKAEPAIDSQKTDIIQAIARVESNYSTNKINRLEGARGCLQIRPVAVAEVNRILGKQVFDTLDCYNVSKSVMMFTIIQDNYNPEWDYETAAKLWNGGPNWKSKESVKNYWLEVKKYIKNN